MKYLFIILFLAKLCYGEEEWITIEEYYKQAAIGRCTAIHGVAAGNSSSYANKGCALQCEIRNSTVYNYLPDGAICPYDRSKVCFILYNFHFFFSLFRYNCLGLSKGRL